MNIDSIMSAIAPILFIAFGATSVNMLLGTRKLDRYMREHHFERWCEITSIGNLGPGLRNSFSALPYIFGDEDNDDDEIFRLKDRVKCSILYIVIIFVAGPIILLLLGIILSKINAL